MPASFYRFYTEKKSKVRPYDKGPPEAKNSKSRHHKEIEEKEEEDNDNDESMAAEENGWSIEYYDQCIDTLSEKYGGKTAREMYERMMGTAEHMLR
jgi:hypothetical protein